MPDAAAKSPSPLRHPLINGWSLFWLFVIPMNLFMFWEMKDLDMTHPPDISHMIGYSVRWAVPFIFIVVASSALPVLFPSQASQYLLRNRRYIGLIFAVGMAWQGLFIFMISGLHIGYYYEEVYHLRNELEGSSGYLFMAALVLTSFSFGRKHLSNVQWKVLHKSGIYFLWAYPFSTYWWNLYYYDTNAPLDYLYYWLGTLAFASRIAAWGVKRSRRHSEHSVALPLKMLAYLIIALAFIAASTGLQWQDPVTTYLLGPAWSANLVLWLPFWPFEPFLPFFAMGIAVWMLSGPLMPSASINTNLYRKTQHN